MIQPTHLITKLIEPKKLLIIWQAPIPGTSEPMGDRFVVGEIINKGASTILRYSDNEDIRKALDLQENRFIGLTAYPYEPQNPNQIFDGNIINVLAQRLPPSSRTDYGDYLKSHMISPDAEGISPLSLLAYTGGRLAGDGFSFCHTFEGAQAPFDFTFEIAGVRYASEVEHKRISDLTGQHISFNDEPNNSYDKEAIAIACDGQKLGYIPKGLNRTFRELRSKYQLSAVIAKVNGTETRPNVVVFVSVRDGQKA